MSHPWMPQPYYMTRQSRLSAPWPTAMGLGGYRSGYAEGVFRQRHSYDMPGYIKDEADDEGVSGLGGSYYSYSGFGLNAEGCVQPEQVAVTIYNLLKGIDYTFQVPSVDVSSITSKLGIEGKTVLGGQTFTLKALLEQGESVLLPALTKGVFELAEKVQSLGDLNKAFEEWIERRLYIDLATNILTEPIADKLNDVKIWRFLAVKAREKLVGDALVLPLANICTGEAPPPDCDTACASIPMLTTTAALAPANWETIAAIRQRCPDKCPAVNVSLSKGVRGYAGQLDRKYLAALYAKVGDPKAVPYATAPVAPTPAAPAAPAPAAKKAGASGALLIGAAALAAMMFLRK